MSKITLQDLKDRARAELTDINVRDDSKVIAVIQDLLKYAVENFNDLEPEAQDYIDSRLTAMVAQAKATIDGLPDSREKRRLSRAHMIARGDQVNAQSHLDALATCRSMETPALLAAEAFVVHALQQAANIIQDATTRTRSGFLDAALMAAYTSVIDDLLAASHLVRHGYCNQASNVLRTTHESLEKAELFLLDPSTAELWATGNSKECWRVLKPSNVRKRLGRDKNDKIYSLLSEVGTHTSFSSFQNRSGRTVDAKEDHVPELTIFIGGTKVLYVAHMTALWTMFSVMSLVLGMSKAFAHDINAEDAVEAIDTLVEQFSHVLTTTMFPQFRECGADTSVFEEFIRSGFGGAWPPGSSGDEAL